MPLRKQVSRNVSGISTPFLAPSSGRDDYKCSPFVADARLRKIVSRAANISYDRVMNLPFSTSFRRFISSRPASASRAILSPVVASVSADCDL